MSEIVLIEGKSYKVHRILQRIFHENELEFRNRITKNVNSLKMAYMGTSIREKIIEKDGEAREAKLYIQIN
jgi:hypothetical protein